MRFGGDWTPQSSNENMRPRDWKTTYVPNKNKARFQGPFLAVSFREGRRKPMAPTHPSTPEIDTLLLSRLGVFEFVGRVVFCIKKNITFLFCMLVLVV